MYLQRRSNECQGIKESQIIQEKQNVYSVLVLEAFEKRNLKFHIVLCSDFVYINKNIAIPFRLSFNLLLIYLRLLCLAPI